MSTSENKQDIDEMFLKMGEKLGWFKNNDLPLSTGTITPKNIKQENIADGKSTDGRKRNRLKLRKKTVKSGTESTGKSISSTSRSCNITKPQSFQALLSSDSEEEQAIAISKTKRVDNHTAVLCSDSDDDNSLFKSKKVNNTVTCVGESFIAPPMKSFSPISDDYNNSIIKKRVSIASCTLDIDNLGEPLVESTRIHRRSSVTYRQMFEGIDESDVSNEQVNDSVLVCDDTKFVTAIEDFESLRLSPDGQTKPEHLNDSKDVTKEINTKNNAEHENVTNEHNLSGNKSCEEVEVVDIGIQTDDAHNLDDGSFTTNTILETSNTYRQETVIDVAGFHEELSSVNGLYRGMTVDDIADVNCNKTDSFSENTEVVSHIDNYLGITENSLKEVDNKDLYKDETEVIDDLHAFNELTDGGIPSVVKRDLYQEDTVDASSGLSGGLVVSVEDSDQSNDEIFHDVENISEASEYEVKDVGTQTDKIHIVKDNTRSEEHVATDDVIDDNSESGVDGKHLKDTSEQDIDQDSEAYDDDDDDKVHDDIEDISSTEECSDSESGKSFHEIAASVKQVKKNRIDDNKNLLEQSWRSRKYSDSSDSDTLDSFFQKMRKKPEPIRSSSESSESPSIMDDFIVEDDDMTSESDDTDFYLRETQEMNKSPDYVPSQTSSSDVESSEEDEENSGSTASSSEGDQPPKHRHQENEKMSSKVSFSSSEENDVDDDLPSNPSDNKMKKKSNSLQQSRLNFEISSDSDSDNDQVVFPELLSIVKPSHKDKKGTISINRSKDIVNDSGQAVNESELFKTPNPIRKKKRCSDKENQFKTPTPVKKSISVSSKGYISLSDDSDSDSTDFVVTPSPRSVKSTPKTMKKILTPVSNYNRKVDSHSTSAVTPTCTFLRSLSCDIDEDRRHSESKKFVKGFKKNKEELSAYLFAMFNRTVFNGKLPSGMSLTWNKRLLRTAGYCAYKKNVKNPEDRTARIELSTKVCDSAERTRDTLVHEMCHAAVWLLNGVNGGHGPYWKYWARHATRIHPELPSISRCHSYSINTKFTYRCKKCSYSIGRHSKSLDTKKKVCGYCRGEFELIQNSEPTTPSSASSTSSSTVTTPRQPNKFALFVKENYNSVKKRKQDSKHGDVMKELSKMFAESKISS